LSSTFPAQDEPLAHVGFSIDGLAAVAAENPFLGPGLGPPSREEISQFFISLITANNAALFLDFQLIDRRCDELLARLLELELLTGITAELAAPPNEASIVHSSSTGAEASAEGHG